MNRRAFLSSIGSAAASLPSIASPSQFEIVPLPLSLGGKPATSIQNGIIPVLEPDLSSFSLIDLTGRLLFSGRLQLPEASITSIRSFAISPRGELVVLSVSALSKDGRLAPALVMATARGVVKAVVRTLPFHIVSITFVDELTLAALGRCTDDQWNEIPGHNVLRFYDLSGQLQAEGFPVETARRVGHHPAQWARLVSGKAKLGFYDRHHVSWQEIDRKGTPLGSPLSLAPLLPKNSEITGVAYDSKDRRVLSVQSDRQTLLFELLQPAPGSARLQEVAGWALPIGVRGATLLGAESDQLVFYAPESRLVLFRR